MASPNAEAAPVAPMSPGGMAALKSKARGVAGAVYSTANAAADAIREAPQVLGNKISDALPGSSKRQASSRQAAASTAETATASKAHSTRDNGSDMSDAIGSKAAKDVTSESTPNAAEQQVIDVLGRITRGSVTGSKGEC